MSKLGSPTKLGASTLNDFIRITQTKRSTSHLNGHKHPPPPPPSPPQSEIPITILVKVKDLWTCDTRHIIIYN